MTEQTVSLPGRRRKRVSFAERTAQVVTALWKNKFWILFMMIVAAGAFAWFSMEQAQKSASATLMLKYEQAYEGLNPNGTRFNIYDIMDDEVLGQTIEKAGLSEEMSIDTLRDSLAVSASGSQKAKNKYIATEYSVALDGKVLPQRISADSMLRLLMETYKQYFLDHYGTDDSALDVDWSDVDNWEYQEFANIMSVKVNNLLTYLNGLRSESGMSQYRISGETFRSLAESITNFQEIYLDKYTSYITVNRLFRNAPVYRNKLEYRRFLTDTEREGNEDRYTICQDALKMYDESMITFVMVPMYDSEQGLYMARTSIGMDNLTEESETYAEKLQTSDMTLKVFDRDLKNVSESSTDPEKCAIADQMILDIEEHLDNLIARIRLAKKDYEVYRSKNSISFTIDKEGMVSLFNLKKAILVAAGVFLLYVFVFALQTGNRQERMK